MTERTGPPWRFSPLRPAPGTVAPTADPRVRTMESMVENGWWNGTLNLVGRRLGGWGDAVVPAVLAAVDDRSQLHGIWGVLQQPDARVVLIEVDRATDAPALARRLRAALPAAVEVFRYGEALPEYHRRALSSASLLWAATAPVLPELIPVYQDDDNDGSAWFDLGRPGLDAQERFRVVRYLMTAQPVLLTDEHTIDVLEPRRGLVVPMSYRTDGRFVWSEATAYYAQEHGLSPHPPLHESIRAAGHTPPVPDRVALFLAEHVLMS